jgi:molybdopterin molybdotransferase
MLTAAGRLRSASVRAHLHDVTAWIDTWAAPLGPEDIPLGEAVGRILTVDAKAAMGVPPRDRAAADGFAIIADETVGAGAYNPLPFRLVPASAGVQAGQTASVECGDPLPAGANAVVRLEHATPDAPGTVAIIAPVVAGNEVELAGSQAVQGGVLVGAGRQLGPAEVGLLASAGVRRVSVTGKPRIRCLLPVGSVDEGGEGPTRGVLHDSNGPLLAALVARDGAVMVERRRFERDRAALRDALGTPEADIVLVAGGTGLGARDISAAALAEAGELVVHGVALRPGETTGAGRAGGAWVFLLPGTPAACLWAYELMAGRAIRRLAGRGAQLPFATRELRLSRKVVSEIGMTEVCPVQCTKGGDVEPLAAFAEAGLVAAAQGDGIVIVPEASEGYPQGAQVTVHLYPGMGSASGVGSAVQDQAGNEGWDPSS